jgi:hypothetical protein
MGWIMGVLSEMGPEHLSVNADQLAAIEQARTSRSIAALRDLCSIFGITVYNYLGTQKVTAEKNDLFVLLLTLLRSPPAETASSVDTTAPMPGPVLQISLTDEVRAIVEQEVEIAIGRALARAATIVPLGSHVHG